MENKVDEPRGHSGMADTAVGTESYAAETAPPRAYERPPLPPLPPPVMTAAAEPRAPQVKTPLLAVALSVFPGLGQLYNEQPAKAVTFFFAFVGAIYGTAEISPFPFAFLIPFVWCYGLIDAWHSAQDINRRSYRGELVRRDAALESPAWGAGLLVLGLALLMNNMGWLHLAALSRYWPLALVIVGALFLVRALRAQKAAPSAERFDERPL